MNETRVFCETCGIELEGAHREIDGFRIQDEHFAMHKKRIEDAIEGMIAACIGKKLDQEMLDAINALRNARKDLRPVVRRETYRPA